MSASSPQPAYIEYYGSKQFIAVLFSLFLAGFAIFSSLYCVQPMMPVFAQFFSVSPAHSSFPLSFSTIALAVGLLFSGLAYFPFYSGAYWAGGQRCCSRGHDLYWRRNRSKGCGFCYGTVHLWNSHWRHERTGHCGDSGGFYYLANGAADDWPAEFCDCADFPHAFTKIQAFQSVSDPAEPLYRIIASKYS